MVLQTTTFRRGHQVRHHHNSWAWRLSLYDSKFGNIGYSTPWCSILAASRDAWLHERTGAAANAGKRSCHFWRSIAARIVARRDQRQRAGKLNFRSKCGNVAFSAGRTCWPGILMPACFTETLNGDFAGSTTAGCGAGPTLTIKKYQDADP